MENGVHAVVMSSLSIILCRTNFLVHDNELLFFIVCNLLG